MRETVKLLVLRGGQSPKFYDLSQMKKQLIELWLGIVSLIAPDPEGKRNPEEQREAQMVAFLMLCFIAFIGYAHFKGWLNF